MPTFLKYEERLNYIIFLAERRRTGTPVELANKLGVSERTVKRMVEVIRQKEIPIVYSRMMNSYEIISD